jgi:hypothetical protein
MNAGAAMGPVGELCRMRPQWRRKPHARRHYQRACSRVCQIPEGLVMAFPRA